MARRVVSLFILATLCTMPLWADIQATVMTIDGAPIADAQVVLVPAETPRERIDRLRGASPQPKVLAEARSDSHGNVTIVLPKGTSVATLQFEHTGYGPARLRAVDGEDLGAVVLPEAKTITGQITAGGKDVEGAIVSWVGQDDAEIVAKTDAKGHYSIPDPKRWGALKRTIVHPDFAVDESLQITRAPDVNGELVRGVTISGRVVAEDGRTPVAGATLSVDGWSMATSKTDGTWTIDHAPDRWQSVDASVAKRSGILSRGTKSTVIRMGRSASLSGTLLDGRANRPIPDALVGLSRGRLERSRFVARTDAKGGYTFPTLPAGNYRMSVDHPAYLSEPVRVAVRPGVANSRNLVATPAGTIAGSIINEKKAVVAAATVATAPRQQGRGRFRFIMRGERTLVYSAPDGRFVVRGVTPDESFDLDVRKTGFPSAKGGPYDLTPAQKKTGVVIVVPSGVRVTGTVTDKDGKPIAGVSITADEATSRGGNRRFIRRMARVLRSQEEDVVQTDAKGKFSMQLREGKYDLSFSGKGYAPKQMNGVEARADAKPIEVVLEPGVELKGRVVRTSGAGVPDVMVDVIAGGAMQEPVTTGSDGSFVVPDLAPGPVMVVAAKPDAYIQEMRSTKVPGDDLVITVPATGGVEGHVIDKASGQPVTDFEVGPSGDRGGPGIRIMASLGAKSIHSDEGHFLLDDVPAGNVALVVNAPGYLSKTLHGLKVKEGETLRNIEVDLEKGVTLTGKVTGPDGSPLEGTTVSPAADNGGGFGLPGMFRGDASAVTDGAGEYTLDAVEPGDATISFEHDGYLPATKSVKLEGGTVHLDAQLSKGKDVEGVVVTDAGQPVSGADVNARSSAQGSGFNSVQSDENGQFVFQGLVPGHYTFTASKTGYLETRSNDVDIATSGPIRLVLGQGAVISGQILGLDPSQFASVTVNARGAGSNSSTSVDSSGAFRLEGAPTGSVRVSATLRSMMNSRTSPTKTVDVEVGSEAHVDLEFSSDTVIDGHVTLDGQPVQSAIVNFTPNDRTIQTRGSTSTDSTGAYEVTGLDDGLYNVTVVELQGFTPYQTIYQVHGSGTFDVNIQGGVLDAQVADDESGEPIEGATVQIDAADTSTTGRRPFLGMARQTDPSGAVEFTSLAEGTYHVRASASGYGNDVEDVTVSEGSTAQVQLKLPRNDGILVSVVDRRDGSPLEATFFVTDGQGRTVYTGRPSPRADGSMRIDVAPGTYQAQVFASGYAATTATLTSPSPTPATIAMSPGGTVVIQSSDSTVETGRLVNAMGQPYIRGRFNRSGEFSVNPGTTQLDNVPAGSWTLQILDAQGSVTKSAAVAVQEGQVTTVTPQ